MSKLSERVKKAKLLRFTPTGRAGQFNTWGSKDEHYIVSLKSDEKEIITPDGHVTVKVFGTHCQKQWYGRDMKENNPWDCRGNIHHTVCYHCLGAIWYSFKSVGKQISFYEKHCDAERALAFGGFLAKVTNQNGKGHVWVVVRGGKEQEKPKLLPAQVNIDTMRGKEDDEGID
jgi:hypothetical protein